MRIIQRQHQAQAPPITSPQNADQATATTTPQRGSVFRTSHSKPMKAHATATAVHNIAAKKDPGPPRSVLKTNPKPMLTANTYSKNQTCHSGSSLMITACPTLNTVNRNKKRSENCRGFFLAGTVKLSLFSSTTTPC